MQKHINVGDRTISDDSDLFIMSEIGVTCNYEISRTKELIDATKEGGADAAKLIFWFPEDVFSNKDVTYEYETAEGTRTDNLFELGKKYEWDLEQWFEIKEYAEEQGIVMFSTVSSPTSVDYAKELSLDALKVGSWDYNNYPLWEQIVSMDLPIFMDTGPVKTHEVAKVVQRMQDAGNEKLILVHCYHTDDYERMNMRTIPYMQEAFSCLSGFSSPNRDSKPDIMAVSMGAQVLEKRLTLDRNEMEGHHHYISLEPDEFDEYVTEMRNVKLARGTHGIHPSESDLEKREQHFRRIVADSNLEEGMELTEDVLAAKRPPSPGVSPEYIPVFVGQTLKTDVDKNDPITWEMV